MKYILGVQSPLTFYLVHRIITLNHFDPKDCLLISGRNYHIPEKYESTYPNVWVMNYGGGTVGRIFSGIHFIQTRRNIQSFDAKIDAFTGGDDYDCYLTYCGDDICNLLVTKTNCRHYYIVEEGMGIYEDCDQKTFSGWKQIFFKYFLKPLYPRLYAIKEYQFNPYHPKFNGFYGVSPDSFAFFKNFPKMVVGNPFETVDIGFSPDAVLSIDPFFKYMDTDKVDTIFRQLSLYLRPKNYKTIVYKYHPLFGVFPDKQKAYDEILHRYFGNNIVQLDDTAVLENILMTYKSDFYSNGSSVQRYGVIAGAKCYDFSSYIRRDSGTLSDMPFEACVKEVKV